jgi:DNA polymerase-3 subunit alpha
MADELPQSKGDSDFVHLHTHSEFSLLDGAGKIKDIVEEAASQGAPALAITDHGGLYGMVPLIKTATDSGVKPIVGIETYVAPRSRTDREGSLDSDPHHLVLLAQNEQGYRNVMKLSSLAHLEGFYGKPRIDHELLQEHSEGIICLSGCMGSQVPKLLIQGKIIEAEELALKFKSWFPDRYFLEIQDHGIPEEDAVVKGILELHRRTGIPMVATNDSHYVKPDDAKAHDVLLAVQTGRQVDDPDRWRFSGSGYYLRSPEEMKTLFKDISPEAVINTSYVANMCDGEYLKKIFKDKYLPTYAVPGGEDKARYLKRLVAQGARERFPDGLNKEIIERLKKELEVIETKGFVDYFLIVWDLIDHARCDGVSVGPGRGSAAGSLVAYCLKIVDVNPLQYGLFFERFLNKERDSPPDIDIDFSDRRRGEVIKYISDKYGKNNVAQIGTIGTFQARSIIRDLGKKMGFDLGQVDALAKLIPEELGIKLDRAIHQSPELRLRYENDPKFKELVDIGIKLEGMAKGVGKHAAGVVISTREIQDVVPVQNPVGHDRKNKGAMVVTQVDKSHVEALGLLKIDFLGLLHLSIIDDAQALIKKNKGVDVDISLMTETLPDGTVNKISMDDKKVLKMIADGDVTGLFQLDTQVARPIVMQVKPDKFQDISAATALGRPGPMDAGMVQVYADRRAGRTPVEYPHPLLEDILKETYGVLVYQEQIMAAAQILANYTLGEADSLRAAMGKKDKEKMAKEWTHFRDGCRQNGLTPEKTQEIWDLMNKFVEYGFNKSHSIAYGLIAYREGWLKANYPREFMSSLLMSKSDFADRASIIKECYEKNMPVLLPDINFSDVGFDLTEDQKGIRYGLGFVKKVNAGTMEQLVEERTEKGPYTSLLDLRVRLQERAMREAQLATEEANADLEARTGDPDGQANKADIRKTIQGPNKGALETLIKAGALDSLGERNALLTELAMVPAATIKKIVTQKIEDETPKAQIGLFDGSEEKALKRKPVVLPPIPTSEHASKLETLLWETGFLGCCLSDRKMKALDEFMGNARDTKIEQIDDTMQKVNVSVGGMVQSVRPTKSKRTGDPLAFVELTDETGTIDIMFCNDDVDRVVPKLKASKVAVIQGKVLPRKPDQERMTILGKDVFTIEEVLEYGGNSKKAFTTISTPPAPIPRGIKKGGSADVVAPVTAAPVATPKAAMQGVPFSSGGSSDEVVI